MISVALPKGRLGEKVYAMFEASGFNIAMGNAFDGLKKKADYVTASNNREGAAKAVRKILTAQRPVRRFV